MELKNPPPPIQRSVAAAMRRARKAADADAGDWAEALGAHIGREINEEHVQAIEAGKLLPLADLLVAASDCSGVPLSALLKDRAWHDLVAQVRELRRSQGLRDLAAG